LVRLQQPNTLSTWFASPKLQLVKSACRHFEVSDLNQAGVGEMAVNIGIENAHPFAECSEAEGEINRRC